LCQVTQVENSINAAQQVIAWNVIVEVEGVEEPVLSAASLTPSSRCTPSTGCHQLRRRPAICQGSFSTKSDKYQTFKLRGPKVPSC
jgi:hypothetical protein